MKAGIYLGRENVEVREVPMPDVGDDDVLIQNIYSSQASAARTRRFLCTVPKQVTGSMWRGSQSAKSGFLNITIVVYSTYPIEIDFNSLMSFVVFIICWFVNQHFIDELCNDFRSKDINIRVFIYNSNESVSIKLYAVCDFDFFRYHGQLVFYFFLLSFIPN